MFKESTSLLFKHIQVVRFYDAKRNTLIYLTFLDKLIDGSPQNSISTVQITNAIFGEINDSGEHFNSITIIFPFYM